MEYHELLEVTCGFCNTILLYKNCTVRVPVSQQKMRPANSVT